MGRDGALLLYRTPWVIFWLVFFHNLDGSLSCLKNES